MVRYSDLFVHEEHFDLHSNSDVSLGKLIVRYEVRRRLNLRNLDSRICYDVHCTQRVCIPNVEFPDITVGSPDSYNLYPAILSNGVALNAASAPRKLDLIDYSPRTLNSSISTSRSASQSSNFTSERQHTAGSSASETNSYGVSVQAGFNAEGPTGDVSAHFDHSETSEHSVSDMQGSSRSIGGEKSGSDSMSIKDWGSYCGLDPSGLAPTWTWTQEYPWNVMQFRAIVNRDSGEVSLPDFIQDRLSEKDSANNTIISPPSELSLFGVDFVCKSTWRIEPDPSQLTGDQVTFEHDLILVQASHKLDGTIVRAFVSSKKIDPIKSQAIDLRLLSLVPIGSDVSAGIVFTAAAFDIAPANGSPFKITSRANNLAVNGSGFSQPMSTDFKSGPAELDVYFKVLDDSADVSLLLKHWIVGDGSCVISVVINGNDAAPIVRHVDCKEGDGIERNITSFTLRDRDYMSPDYCDLLKIGMNSLKITIKPAQGSTAGYSLRALVVA